MTSYLLSWLPVLNDLETYLAIRDIRPNVIVINISDFLQEMNGLAQQALNENSYACLEKTLDMVAKHPSIYEYYNAETGDPPANAADTFGWTAAVFIDLAIQASREEGDGNG